MEKSDIYKLDGNNPVRLKDEKIGLLIRYPAEDNLCGIQVPGEEDIRWINLKKHYRSCWWSVDGNLGPTPN